MRTFWLAILALALVTVALFAGSAWRQARAARDEAARATAAEADAKARSLAAAIEAGKAQQPSRTPEASAPSQPPAQAAATAPAAPGPAVHNPKPATIQPAEGAAAKKPSKPLPPLVSPTLAPAKVEGYDVMGAPLIDRTEDGALVFGNISIKGEGTQDNPYIVPWDALVSAQDSFDPTAGSLRIPEHVAILHDKWVRLDGYVSFPLMTNEPKELLAMLNMWDGCCIGVPPTPYDAVEVHLKKALTGDERFAVSGRVTGRFGVKPYVVKSWLVGMYTMEDAAFAPAQDNGGT